MKKASEANDAAAIQRRWTQLMAAQHKAAESLYKQQAASAGGAGGPGAGDAGAPGGGASDSSAGGGEPKGDVIDAEVVDDRKSVRVTDMRIADCGLRMMSTPHSALRTPHSAMS